MRKYMTIAAALLLCALASAQSLIPSGETFIRQLQERDSILIADQLEYGFELDALMGGDALAFPDYSESGFMDSIEVVRSWKVDTLAFEGSRKDPSRHASKIKASIVIAPFDEGEYLLPPLAVQRTRGGVEDTLVFDPQTIRVTTIPIDTATFEIHDIKGQIRYPLTFAEVAPYLVAAHFLGVLAVLVACLIMSRRRKEETEARKEPAYIVALRGLDRYRGDKYWAAEKQKTMYSGITDTLRTYIEDRFGVNAEEMTTAEIFDSLKGCEDIPQDLYAEVKSLFELSDFVKFAKHVASESDNASAIPTAVRFVTATYQSQLDAEAAQKQEEGQKE